MIVTDTEWLKEIVDFTFPDLQDNLNDSSVVYQLSMVTSGGTGSAATNNIHKV